MMNDFKYVWCCRCLDNFPMREEMYDNLEECGNTFYCPVGHTLVITRASVVQELRTSKKSMNHRSEIISVLEKRAMSFRGVQTRQRNRLLRGDCPYCGESAFVTDLVGHIQTHHKPKEK